MTDTTNAGHADAVAREVRHLQGIWRQTYCEADGEMVPEDVHTRFTGHRFVVTDVDDCVLIEGTFVLDPTCTPGTIDWTDTFGDDAGKTFPSIYVLAGDRLTFCAADENHARPESLEEAGPGQVLRVHERVSEAAEPMTSNPPGNAS